MLRTKPIAAENSDRAPPAPRGRVGGAVTREALEHLDSLHHFARYLTGNASEAEDLVQETYTRALGAESSFTSGTNMRAWLFRILRNTFIDSRRRSRSARLVGLVGLVGQRTEEHAANRASNAYEPLRGDIEMEALRGVVAENIERALGELTPDARMVVLLDLEGFTENEVSEVIGCPVGTVKSRLSRARDALRGHLGEYRR